MPPPDGPSSRRRSPAQRHRWQPLQRLEGQQHPAQPDGQRRRGTAAADEGRGQPGQTQQQPAPGDEGPQPDDGPVHHPGQRQVAGQQLIFPIVPLLAGLLGQAGAVAHHLFDQVVGHGQAGPRPALAIPKKSPALEKGQPQPAQEQQGVLPAAGPGGQDRRGDEQLDAGQEGQGLHRFGFDHPPQQLADPLVADLVRIEPQRAAAFDDQHPLERLQQAEQVSLVDDLAERQVVPPGDSVAKVFEERAVPELDRRVHPGRLPAQRFEPLAVEGAAIDQTLPASRPVPAQQGPHQARLARAGGADDGHVVARPDGQIDVF